MKKQIYLNIGVGEFISTDEVIGVFDLDHCTVSKRGREYLESSEKKGNVSYKGTDLPKSFIINRVNGVVLSQYNTSTIIQKERIVNV